MTTDLAATAATYFRDVLETIGRIQWPTLHVELDVRTASGKTAHAMYDDFLQAWDDAMDQLQAQVTQHLGPPSWQLGYSTRNGVPETHNGGVPPRAALDGRSNLLCGTIHHARVRAAEPGLVPCRVCTWLVEDYAHELAYLAREQMYDALVTVVNAAVESVVTHETAR